MFVPIFLKDWVLVQNKKKCTGSEVYKGTLPTIAECAFNCQGIASMFVFGTNNGCIFGLCRCLCETSASGDGSCHQKDHNGYRLYKYKGNLIKV